MNCETAIAIDKCNPVDNVAIRFYTDTASLSEVDNELFRNNGDFFELTKMAQYIIISQAKKKFSKMIVNLDTASKFHAVFTKMVVDENVLKEKRASFTKQISDYDEMVSEYKDKMPQYFETRMSIPSVAKWISNFDCNMNIPVEMAIQGYKYASAMIKDFDAAPLRTQATRYIKPEYKDEYEAFKENARAKTGWIGEAALEELCPKIETISTRLKLNRESYTDKTSFINFENLMIEYLIRGNVG